jgi:hypothetical protein
LFFEHNVINGIGYFHAGPPKSEDKKTPVSFSYHHYGINCIFCQQEMNMADRDDRQTIDKSICNAARPFDIGGQGHGVETADR